MIPLDFLHVRPRCGIGQNDLPGRPCPQGTANPPEAQGASGRDTRRGHLEPTSGEVLNKGQAPQTKGETGQGHEAQDRQRGRTLVIPRPKCCFKSRIVSSIENLAP